MKAYLKLTALHFVKSGSLLWFLGFVIFYLWDPKDVLDSPIFAVILMHVCLSLIADARRVSEISGYKYYLNFFPVSVKERITAEYILGAVLSLLSVVILINAGYWTRSLFRLFPGLAFMTASVYLPWHYLKDSIQFDGLARFCSALLILLVDGWFREVPLVIQSYPLWLLILFNLFLIILYVLSAFMADLFANKRRAQV